jgi:hypothetical protein
MLGEFVDGAALAGGVAPLEDDHDALALPLDPALQLDKLDLQRLDLLAVLFALHALVIRVAAAPERLGGDVWGQHGIVDIEARQLLAGADILKQDAIGHASPPSSHDITRAHDYINRMEETSAPTPLSSHRH